ncbi:MAG TPA: imidazolonepropionase [Rectinemataceae bacterium]|nr:imidazolonepropionase [Rectinemataceae bacterium]
MSANLVVKNIGELATPRGFEAPRGRDAMGRVEVTKDALVLVLDGKIAWVGPEAAFRADPALARRAEGLPVLDAKKSAVIPGFVDSHSHFAFAGFRDEEFLWRAGGLPYMEIHRRGGGIRTSMTSTRAAGLDELVALGGARLDRMLALGITTVEGKSGYGLDRDTELRQLEAMRLLSARQPIDIVPTFLGPHSTPPEFEGRPSTYMDFVIGEVLPEVRERGLARFCDVFCEKGVFEIADSRRYLEAAKAMGFGLKLHADEIERIGGAGLAAELGATSADHLLKADKADIEKMAKAGVVATNLPLTAFTLREPYADARGAIDAGCALSLASDLNPGSCYSQSFPLMIAIAVLYLGLSLEEALVATTLGGAAALDMADRVGSIEPGKEADLLVLDAPSYRHLAYNVGMNQARAVVKKGALVFGN